MPPRRGEVWLFDLGMTAKTRPVLVVSVDYGDTDRAIVTVVPTQPRFDKAGSKFLSAHRFSGLAPFWYRAFQRTRKHGPFESSAYCNHLRFKPLPMDWPLGWASDTSKTHDRRRQGGF